MDSFEDIYVNYHDDVFRFLYKLCGRDYDLSDELTEDTFYHAYLNIARFKGECHVKTWLLQIAKNRFFLYLKKHRYKCVPFDDLSGLLDESADDLFEKSYKNQLIKDALQIIFSFDENMRYVFISRIFLDMPYKDIAQNAGICENSAKTLFYRGKLLLRKKLKEEFGYEL